MKLFWTEPAIQDLQDLRDYIAYDSDIHAASFVSSILVRVEQLEKFPLMGRVVPEAQTDNIREIIYRTYRIIYRVSEQRSMFLRSSTEAEIFGINKPSPGTSLRC